MGAFGKSSLRRLENAHPDLKRLFDVVVVEFDCAILESVRSPEQQAQNVKDGVSHTYDSRHLADENGISWAVDACPYPLIWPDPKNLSYVKDLARWYYFGGYVLGVARCMNIRVRWGGDWNGNRDIKDQSFDDLGHFEIRRGADHLNILGHPHVG
jgi:peptidoglycan L-alanyl-D-glutamate endopeptidase CwlK